MNVKVIKNPSDARKLLKMGNVICDIKAKKEDPIQTVFVFISDDKFWSDFKKLEIKI